MHNNRRHGDDFSATASPSLQGRALRALNVMAEIREIKGAQVDKFIEANCTEIATDETGWESLFRDRKTKELWVRTFPESYLHGGGQPLLRFVTLVEAKEKFKF